VLDADGDVHAGWKVELLQLIHGASGWVNDIKQALVCPDLELIHGLLVDVRGAVHGELLDACWQRDGTCHFGTSALGSLYDVGSGLVQRPIIVGPEADSDSLVLHDL